MATGMIKSCSEISGQLLGRPFFSSDHPVLLQGSMGRLVIMFNPGHGSGAKLLSLVSGYLLKYTTRFFAWVLDGRTRGGFIVKILKSIRIP